MREKSGRKDPLATSRLRVGSAIRARRIAAGLSLAELAKRVGVALSTMSKIETGKVSTSFERLEAVSGAMDADLAEFLGVSGLAVPTSAVNGGRSDPAYGTRRSITQPDEGRMVDAGNYLEWFHAADMLHKRFQPVVVDILVGDIADYGTLTQHSGEEFNYVLEGELEFHTEVYAPVRLKAGSSIYFDAEMRHAHIKVGSAPCRILGILCPRSESSGSARPTGTSLRVVEAGQDAAGLMQGITTSR
jgi:transcriptional regulator with XRE-family HTH domain